jgi:uncharacterized protein YjaZ
MATISEYLSTNLAELEQLARTTAAKYDVSAFNVHVVEEESTTRLQVSAKFDENIRNSAMLFSNEDEFTKESVNQGLIDGITLLCSFVKGDYKFVTEDDGEI